MERWAAPPCSDIQAPKIWIMGITALCKEVFSQCGSERNFRPVIVSYKTHILGGKKPPKQPKNWVWSWNLWSAKHLISSSLCVSAQNRLCPSFVLCSVLIICLMQSSQTLQLLFEILLSISPLTHTHIPTPRQKLLSFRQSGSPGRVAISLIAYCSWSGWR